MKPKEKRRFWTEVAGAGSSGLLCVLTAVWPDWMEAISGVNPDHYSGSFERLIVASLLLITIVFCGLARFEWRRTIGFSES